jgi:hypothetical protein
MCCRRVLVVVVLCLATVIVQGCASGPKVQVLASNEEFDSGRSVVVLPTENRTMDVDAGEITRLFVYLALEQRGFVVYDLEATDEVLLSSGMSTGAHVAMADRSELQKAFDGRDLVFVRLLEASYKTLVVKSVSASVEMEVWSDGVTLWHETGKHSSSSWAGILNPVQALLGGIVDKAIEGAFKKYYDHPLFSMIEQVVMSMKKKLPGKEHEPSGW